MIEAENIAKKAFKKEDKTIPRRPSASSRDLKTILQASLPRDRPATKEEVIVALGSRMTAIADWVVANQQTTDELADAVANLRV